MDKSTATPATTADSGSPVTATPPSPDEGIKRTDGKSARSVARGIAYRYSLVFVLILMVVVFSVLLPTMFPTLANLRTITATQAVLMIVALGLTFPLAAGEFDLSFGGVLGLSSTLVAVLTVEQGWSLLPAVGVCLGMGLFIGALNATIIIRLGVNSLVTTLGMGTVLLGMSLFVSNNQVIAGHLGLLFDAATGVLFGLPYPVYFALGLAVIAWYVQEYTPFGRYVYFTGEGREAARLSGINVDRVRLVCFAITGFTASLAGIVNFGRLGSADPNIGSLYLLPGFATVFLGATAIKPGRYNAWGTVLAVYVLVVGIVGLQLLGGAGFLEHVFNGLALILAVVFSVGIRRSLTGE